MADGNYTVDVRNGVGTYCDFETTSVTLNDPTIPTVSISTTTDPLTCSDGSTTLTASGADSYIWDTGESTASITKTTG